MKQNALSELFKKILKQGQSVNINKFGFGGGDVGGIIGGEMGPVLGPAPGEEPVVEGPSIPTIPEIPTTAPIAEQPIVTPYVPGVRRQPKMELQDTNDDRIGTPNKEWTPASIYRFNNMAGDEWKAPVASIGKQYGMFGNDTTAESGFTPAFDLGVGATPSGEFLGKDYANDFGIFGYKKGKGQKSPYSFDYGQGGIATDPFTFDTGDKSVDKSTGINKASGMSGGTGEVIGSAIGAIGSIIAGLLEPDPPDPAAIAGRYPLLKRNPALALMAARAMVNNK